MTGIELQQVLLQHTQLSALRKSLDETQMQVLVQGLHASAKAGIIGSVADVIVADDLEKATYLAADMSVLGIRSMLFPSSRRRRQSVDAAMVVQRTEVLAALENQETSDPKTNKTPETSKNESRRLVVVTYAEALSEPVPARERLAERSLTIKQGEKRKISELTEKLAELGFERVDFVFEPGQYAVRGGIVDIYSFSHDDPYRLDYFGDEIDSLRTFDIETQLSHEKVTLANIVGHEDGEDSSDLGKQAHLDDYLPSSCIWADLRMERIVLSKSMPLITTGEEETEKRSTRKNSKQVMIGFEMVPQPTFNKQFNLLEEDLRAKRAEGYTIYIAAEQKKQNDRLHSIFATSNEEHPDLPEIVFTPIEQALHEGFVDKELQIAVYTDHQIFERYHRVSRGSENARRGKAVVTLRELNQLQIGDYVVHSDHGIGTFGGLVTTTANGKPQEMIRINFREGDYIFVSIHNLHRISKYKGKEGSAPTISRLGSGAWERLKERTKDKVKDIARGLIQLYAKRKQQPGFRYSPDGYMQHELEASFLYEDTPDQAKATIDVKHDMESSKPMDRLICGDVGFGKTEVAIRAAFKAATDGKQVAVLVPTTVLALQHYNTLRERLHDFPVTVEQLSRVKTAAETRDILERLEQGKIDILVGTHKIVGKNVKWKDLGLLIIDEEQKFGVAVKEKLKSLRTNVDVLTLTATPIPRTLQFSLLGARDLSVMTTPPPNRYPVQTELINTDDEDIIREAIEMEMSRNGQVFVVNNRIDMLDRVADRLQRLVPEARIVIAHGQMPADDMEKRLEDFINYEYDILVSTTIIESGIDIPNVNTMLIYSAQQYGLSDLHQLRGRVGRSNRKAYCYLITPDRELLTADARRRLEAIETFAELGSGFNLAMQDLDIRGAGNMLGAEQSGFIADLGYETYQRILNEAVEELRDELQLEQTSENNSGSAETGNGNWVSDCQLETDLQLSLPATYVENISERITLYRELDGLRNEDELAGFEKRLIDRFGAMPDEAKELMQVVRLRWLCCKMGIEKIFLKAEKLALHFSNKNERYKHSDTFMKIIRYATDNPKHCAFHADVDKKTKAVKNYITIGQVKTIAEAINLLEKVNGQTINNNDN